ncbi:MAG: lysophospholipid acyltransferase family protein [Pseudohongiella sp.]|nr:lysophospholipid acyltransferase family protein [Pseudohongiella sp.]
MINKVRSILFSIGYAGLTFVISLLVILVFWLLPAKRRFYLYALWCRLVVRWLRITCGVKHMIEGSENIPAHPVIVLSNHQSTWETIFLYQLFTPVCPILKKELLDIPFWGWAIRLQQPIAIDRSKPREAGKSLLTQGAQRIKEGLSILVFPEGTRAPAGTLGKFSRGGAQLATATETMVLPVLHNAGSFWPAGTSRKKPGTIKVVIGEPISSIGKQPKELAAEFESWVSENKHRVGIE